MEERRIGAEVSDDFPRCSKCGDVLPPGEREALIAEEGDHSYVVCVPCWEELTINGKEIA